MCWTLKETTEYLQCNISVQCRKADVQKQRKCYLKICKNGRLHRSFCLFCRWGSGIFEHDQERPCGSGRWGHHGMHHGAGAGRVRLQTSDPQTLTPAHVTTCCTGWVWGQIHVLKRWCIFIEATADEALYFWHFLIKQNKNNINIITWKWGWSKWGWKQCTPHFSEFYLWIKMFNFLYQFTKQNVCLKKSIY